MKPTMAILEKINQNSKKNGYETKKGKKRLCLPNKNDCKTTKVKDKFSNNMFSHSYSTTTFEKRLAAKECELCGAKGNIKF